MHVHNIGFTDYKFHKKLSENKFHETIVRHPVNSLKRHIGFLMD